MKTTTAQQAIQELVRHGYSQREIADAANLNQATVSRIADGKITNIGINTHNQIMEAHRLTLGECDE